MKRETIKYCVTRARYRRGTREFLQECMLEVVNADVLDWARYLELKREFRAWERNVLSGFEVRSRNQQNTSEETPSIYQVNKTKNNFTKSKIEKLYTPFGTEVVGKPEIAQEILKHFSAIFQNQASPDNSFASDFLKGVANIVENPPGTGIDRVQMQ